MSKFNVGDKVEYIGNDHEDDNEEVSSLKNINMTNEEIWKMLKPKMEGNKLLTPFWGTWGLSYYEKDVYNAVALAYRFGYERAMKGRPFKFGGKKKKGGHWEPVDPNNLPKEGTRVRYSRECRDYCDSPDMIILGDIGVFKYGKYNTTIPGIYFNDGRYWSWISFNKQADCLDMWVEDDE